MAKKYLDDNGLLYFWQKIKTAFLTDVTYNSTSKKIQKTKNGSTSDVVTLSTVATSGSYNDLSNTPTIPSAVQPTTTTPKMDGTAAVGSESKYARGDHVHPTDTSRVPTTRTVNGHALSADVTVTASDIGVEDGAEVNQNAFSNVKVGTTTVAADAKTDTLELVAGSNITITPDATNDKITIASTAEVSDVMIGSTSVVSNGVATIPDSKTAASGGTDLSMVTTGEKYTWNNKASNSVFTAPSSASSAGTKGLVPAPEASTYTYRNTTVLTAGRTWSRLTLTTAADPSDSTKQRLGLQVGSNTSYTSPTEATSSMGGFMSATDKSKLDSITMTNGVIDSSVLPSFVDDVIEAYPVSGATALSAGWLSATSGGSALTPETGKIYVLMADSGDYAANTQFRWSGTTYVKLADGGVSSITNSEIDTIVAS